MTWIMDWSKLDDRKKYLYAPINSRDDGSLYLGLGTAGVREGWWAKQTLRQGCYAALELPDFDTSLVPWKPVKR